MTFLVFPRSAGKGLWLVEEEVATMALFPWRDLHNPLWLRS